MNNLCVRFSLSVDISIGFPFDFYGNKSVIFLTSVSQAQLVDFCGASAILWIVELRSKEDK